MMKKLEMACVAQGALNIAQRALDWLYPANIYCACCKDTIDRSMPYSLCSRCIREINWASEEISTDGSGGSKPHLFCRGFSCARYDGRTKEMLRHFKFEGQPHLSKGLGALMLARICKEDLQPDIIVPVPMFKGKERMRGYNQAALLAAEVAAGWQAEWSESQQSLKAAAGMPILEEHLLIRRKETAAMSALSNLDRRLNLQGAFCIQKKMEKRLIDKKVLLIDDVMTTGTTADECCRVLLQAGAARVDLLVFASGE